MRAASRLGALLGAAGLLLSGCFSYVPAEPGAVPEGEEVRVFLVRSVRETLPEEIAPDGRSLEGRVVGRTGDSLTIRVPVFVREAGTRRQALRQDVRVPTGGILELELRTPDRARTALLVAGAAGAVGTVLVLILDEGGGRPQDSPGDPDVVRIPILSVPTG